MVGCVTHNNEQIMEGQDQPSKDTVVADNGALTPFRANENSMPSSSGEQSTVHEDMSVESQSAIEVKQFSFSFDSDNNMMVKIRNVQDENLLRHVTFTGYHREMLMKENREKLKRKEPFSEFVRFYNVIDHKRHEKWNGVSLFDLMFLTLNSRFRVRKELSSLGQVKETKALVYCKRQRKLCRIISVEGAMRYICSMNARLPERRLIKQCLVDVLCHI